MVYSSLARVRIPNPGLPSTPQFNNLAAGKTTWCSRNGLPQLIRSFRCSDGGDGFELSWLVLRKQLLVVVEELGAPSAILVQPKSAETVGPGSPPSIGGGSRFQSPLPPSRSTQIRRS